MAAYVKAINGYIADSAEVYFNRCDKKVFYFDECSSSSFTPTFNQLEITGGWGLFPLAFINTGSTLEGVLHVLTVLNGYVLWHDQHWHCV